MNSHDTLFFQNSLAALWAKHHIITQNLIKQAWENVRLSTFFSLCLDCPKTLLEFLKEKSYILMI